MGSLLPSEQAAGSRPVYTDFEKLSSAPRRCTDLMLRSSIREHHPDLTLTVTPTASCDLLGFAKAGYATADLDLDDGSFYATRSYHPPKTQLDGAEGAMGSQTSFAKYEYHWFEHDFIVYIAEGYRDPMSSTQSNYILHKPARTETVHSQAALIDELVRAASQWTLELHKEILVFDMGRWKKSKELWNSIQGASWEDVVMDDDTKKALISDVEGFFDARDTYKKFSVAWKRGIIFHGPPGNGKTSTTKALINTLYKRPQSIASLYVKSFNCQCGGPEYSIREIFRKARETAPCLLILEDIDSLVTDAVRSYFLNEVDGLESNEGILILGSTNHLEKLDPGIAKRPSRFDRKYPFNVPVLSERVQYCEYWREKLNSNPDTHFPASLCPRLADLMDEFTFAYVKEAFVATLLRLASQPAKKPKAKGESDDPDASPFYDEFEAQVRILREQMAEKAPAEAVKTETTVVVQR